MSEQPLLTDLPNMLAEYEKKFGMEHIKVIIYSDGVGELIQWDFDEQIFEFNSIPELIQKLKY
jgi:ABC-type microcin C transport system permease subunit YejB